MADLWLLAWLQTNDNAQVHHTQNLYYKDHLCARFQSTHKHIYYPCYRHTQTQAHATHTNTHTHTSTTYTNTHTNTHTNTQHTTDIHIHTVTLENKFRVGKSSLSKIEGGKTLISCWVQQRCLSILSLRYKFKGQNHFQRGYNAPLPHI